MFGCKVLLEKNIEGSAIPKTLPSPVELALIFLSTVYPLTLTLLSPPKSNKGSEEKSNYVIEAGIIWAVVDSALHGERP